ncbi:MAG: HD domain-containing protein [Patescibacteria group bacterium]
MISQTQKHIRHLAYQKTNPFGPLAYDHIYHTVRYAQKMARATGANREIVTLAAWFHDVGSLLGDYQNHHRSGAAYAAKYLNQLKYPPTKIKQIEHCILAHRGSLKIARRTLEAKCVADADAMSHFADYKLLFHVAKQFGEIGPAANRFVLAKLDRSYNKLTPAARRIIRPRYQKIKSVLK